MPPPNRHAHEAAVTIPLIDRLIDEEPHNSREEMLTRAQSVRLLKAGLRRDLEWLLNTRRIPDEPEAALQEINRSVYVFGLPDFTSFSLASHTDQSRLLRELQTVLRLFEPRLTAVKVIPQEVSATNTRTLRFRIEGLLMMDPAPEVVSFDTVLELTSSEYKIRGDTDGQR
jgi:type VI secretion system protein ImpF